MTVFSWRVVNNCEIWTLGIEYHNFFHCLWHLRDSSGRQFNSWIIREVLCICIFLYPLAFYGLGITGCIYILDSKKLNTYWRTLYIRTFKEFIFKKSWSIL